jgi:ferritin
MEDTTTSMYSVVTAKRSDIQLPATLDQEVVDMLNRRLGDEYTAHYFYRNAANWCADKAYNKAAAFFTQEAANELQHAEMLQTYLVGWNATPIIPPISMSLDFLNLIDIVNKAYDLEFNLLIAYNKNSAAMFPGDLSTFDFLQDLRKGQTQSVAEYADLLNAAQLVNVSNNFEVLYYEQTYF